MALVVEHGIRWHDRFIDLQSITLKKVGGETRSPAHFWAPVPIPWKQEGTKSREKRRVSRGLCGIVLF